MCFHVDISFENRLILVLRVSLFFITNRLLELSCYVILNLILSVALLCESGKPIRVSSIATKSGLSLQRSAEGQRALADKARERSDKRRLHISPPWEGKAVNLALLASDSALADKVRERSDLLGGGSLLNSFYQPLSRGLIWYAVVITTPRVTIYVVVVSTDVTISLVQFSVRSAEHACCINHYSLHRWC